MSGAQRARVFDLGGTGLKTAFATRTGGGVVTLDNARQLGRCEPAAEPRHWIRDSVRPLEAEISDGVLFACSAAVLDKLWTDGRDRSGGANLCSLLALPSARCARENDGYAHLVASVADARLLGVELQYPIWNIAIGTGVAIYCQVDANSPIQEVCEEAYNLPCPVAGADQREAVYAVLGGSFRNNAELRNRSSADRRAYERQCVEFVKYTVTVGHQASRPIACVPATVIFTGGLLDHNPSLFRNPITDDGIRYIRGPQNGGLLGAAYMAFDIAAPVAQSMNAAEMSSLLQHNYEDMLHGLEDNGSGVRISTRTRTELQALTATADHDINDEPDLPVNVGVVLMRAGRSVENPATFMLLGRRNDSLYDYARERSLLAVMPDATIISRIRSILAQQYRVFLTEQQISDSVTAAYRIETAPTPRNNDLYDYSRTDVSRGSSRSRGPQDGVLLLAQEVQHRCEPPVWQDRPAPAFAELQWFDINRRATDNNNNNLMLTREARTLRVRQDVLSGAAAPLSCDSLFHAEPLQFSDQESQALADPMAGVRRRLPTGPAVTANIPPVMSAAIAERNRLAAAQRERNLAVELADVIADIPVRAAEVRSFSTELDGAPDRDRLVFISGRVHEQMARVHDESSRLNGPFQSEEGHAYRRDLQALSQRLYDIARGRRPNTAAMGAGAVRLARPQSPTRDPAVLRSLFRNAAGQATTLAHDMVAVNSINQIEWLRGQIEAINRNAALQFQSRPELSADAEVIQSMTEIAAAVTQAASIGDRDSPEAQLARITPIAVERAQLSNDVADQLAASVLRSNRHGVLEMLQAQERIFNSTQRALQAIPPDTLRTPELQAAVASIAQNLQTAREQFEIMQTAAAAAEAAAATTTPNRDPLRGQVTPPTVGLTPSATPDIPLRRQVTPATASSTASGRTTAESSAGSSAGSAAAARARAARTRFGTTRLPGTGRVLFAPAGVTVASTPRGRVPVSVPAAVQAVQAVPSTRQPAVAAAAAAAAARMERTRPVVIPARRAVARMERTRPVVTPAARMERTRPAVIPARRAAAGPVPIPPFRSTGPTAPRPVPTARRPEAPAPAYTRVHTAAAAPRPVHAPPSGGTGGGGGGSRGGGGGGGGSGPVHHHRPAGHGTAKHLHLAVHRLTPRSTAVGRLISAGAGGFPLRQQ
jgi:hypothetical protein